MLTQKIRKEKKYAAIEIAAGLAALDETQAEWHMSTNDFVLDLWTSINWIWWTVGRKVKNIDEAYQDADDAISNEYELAMQGKSWTMTSDYLKEIHDRLRCFNIFIFNTWRIDASCNNPHTWSYPNYAPYIDDIYTRCYFHAHNMALMSLCKDGRWDVWEEEIPQARYHDFLAYENDPIAREAWEHSVEDAYLDHIF